METLKSLRDEVSSWLDETGDTVTETRIDLAINDAHARRVLAMKWPFMLWKDTESFTTVVGQDTYQLHPLFGLPFWFIPNGEDSSSALIEVPPKGILEWDTQSSRHFKFIEPSPVKAQPASASVITIVSTAAGDTGSAYAVVILGVNSAGDVVEESINPNGVTPASGSTSFTRIIAVTKTGTWTGTLTVSAGATTLLTLQPAEFGKLYSQIQFQVPPETGKVIKYRFYRKPRSLTRDHDIPDIPDSYAKILVWDALKLLSAYTAEVDPGRVQIWNEQQAQLDIALRQNYLEGQTLGARVRYIKDPDGD